MSQKLFISFTRTLFGLHAGHITAEDLENGLFYFGCTRDHVFNPGQEGDFNELEYLNIENQEDRDMLLARLSDAVLRAEEKNHVAWRHFSTRNAFLDLNILLEKNHFRSVGGMSDAYRNLAVKKLVEATNPELEVVW